MNEKQIARIYAKGKKSLREIAVLTGTNHKLIARIVRRNGATTIKRYYSRPLSEKHKQSISESCKGRKVWSEGKTMTHDHNLKNMKAHLKYDVSLEWLGGFTDIEKLKYLNRSISRRRDYEGFTTGIYIRFVEKFYHDKKFNALFDEWRLTKNKWIKPSLDHIEAKATGGGLHLENLQFVSWFENRAKMDIPQAQWDEMKKNLAYYL